jgi:hypothetical protein
MRSATLAQLDGSDPQRLSFGDPVTVRANFAEKVRVCWFGGSAPVLQGYRFDAAASSAAGDAPAGAEAMVPHILILPAGDDQNAVFVVEFHPFNDNTLISTRNLSLPSELASRLKRDVEVWIFGDRGCGSSRSPLMVTHTPAVAPAVQPAAKAHFQEASWMGAASAHLSSTTADLSPR